jgi:hypothetical protein
MSVFGNGLALPVILGLSVGIAFVLMIVYLSNYEAERETDVNGALVEFTVPPRLPEVKLFLSKYPVHLATPSLHRSIEDHTIEFDYTMQKLVNFTAGGDYSKSVLRKLDLWVVYDESHGFIQNHPDDKPLRMNATCSQPSPRNPFEWVNVTAPAYDGQVLDFIRDSKCVS